MAPRRNGRFLGAATIAGVLASVAIVSGQVGIHWRRLASANTPPARLGHAACYDETRSEIVMYGGFFGVPGPYYQDTWTWDGSDWRQRPTTSMPPARAGHGLACDGLRGEAVLFGGFGPGGILLPNETWTWDGATWSWRNPLAAPPARSGFDMVYDAVRDEVVLFGGQNVAGVALGDTWTWDGGNWTQRFPAVSPPARERHAMAYQPSTGRTLLFGGVNTSGTRLGDTWEWDGATWIPRPGAGPPPRIGHKMTGGDDRVVLFGGGVTPGTVSSETWLWDGNAWQATVSVSSPAAANLPSLAYHVPTASVLLFGGNRSAAGMTSSETWQLAPVQSPTNLIVSFVDGQQVSLRFRAPVDGTPPTGYILKGGLSPGQVQGAILTGSTAPVFTFIAPTGSFFVRVHSQAGAAESGPSNEVRLNVNVPVPPSAPVNFLGMVNGSSLALAWRNTFAGGPPSNLTLDVTGSLTGSFTLGLTDTFQLPAVPAGTYTLSVRATNAAGSSPSSNAVTMAFPSPCSGAPGTPANFLVYKLGSTVFVVWDPPEGGPAPTGYLLSVTGAFVGSIPTGGRTLSGTVGPGSYGLSVRATNPCGGSAFTPEQVVSVP